jgi:hypothetical protein
MLAQFADSRDVFVIDRTTKSALLLPDGAGGDVQELARRAERAHQRSTTIAWCLKLRGIAEHRAGRHKVAAECLEKVDPAWTSAAITADAFLALARHELGQEREARAALERAVRRAATELPAADSGRVDRPDGIEGWLMAKTALREAEETVAGRRPTSLPANPPSSRASPP